MSEKTLHVCSMLKLPWLADKTEILILEEVLRLFRAKKSKKVHSKKGEKVGPKTGPELKPIFGACMLSDTKCTEAPELSKR